MKFEITILGSNSATPAFGRNQSAQVININEILYLVDCGEATQIQLEKYSIRRNRIKHIFISHLHGDHYLGLVGLLSSMNLNGRKDSIHLYGPKPLEELINLHLKHSHSELRYPLIFHPTQSEQPEVILDNKDVKVSTFPLQHRIPCTGFRFDEKEGLPRINKNAIQDLDIPPIYFPLIKQGECYEDKVTGKVFSSEELTLPPYPSRSYAYCSDTVFTNTYFSAIKNVNLLYHEATFLHELVSRATETYHTTALQAALVAKEVNSKKLLIGHFSSRYKDLEPLLLESKSAFDESYLAIEGETHIIELFKDIE